MKDIKDYLHLYLGCNVTSVYPTNPQSAERLTGKLYDKIMDCENDHFTHHPKFIRLVLRPLSSMTEEDKIKIFKISFGEDHEYTSFGFDNIERIILADKNKISRCGISIGSMNVEATRYLLSKGFDLFGLIEAGLAIEKKN